MDPSNIKPRIEHLPKTYLVGMCTKMTFAQNRTKELWQSFMPRRNEVKNTMDHYRYSVEIFPNTDFFKQFNPTIEFEKWAAIAVSKTDDLPNEMEHLTLPEGDYAVFTYIGKPSEAQPFFQHIFTAWLPNSEYFLDNRPHFALMGEKYKGEHSDSEEEIWVPVRKV